MAIAKLSPTPLLAYLATVEGEMIDAGTVASLWASMSAARRA
jgi:hypothetical protein